MTTAVMRAAIVVCLMATLLAACSVPGETGQTGADNPNPPTAQGTFVSKTFGEAQQTRAADERAAAAADGDAVASTGLQASGSTLTQPSPWRERARRRAVS